MNAAAFCAATIPARAGVGLKPEHYKTIVESRPDIGWFEIHAENYMGAGGPVHHYLGEIRRDYPLSVHGVGLSLGSAEGLSTEHLSALKLLIERYQPDLVSEHLSWSRYSNHILNDLLPVPYTEEVLEILLRNIDHTQTFLGRQILIENPSTYLQLDYSNYSESAFIVELARRSGAGILLDVNNVFVSACNHGFDAENYILNIPPELVMEIHLAGHSLQSMQGGEIRIDDHGSEVALEVWDLFQLTLKHVGQRPTLVEWDMNIPAWETLYDQAVIADQILLKTQVKPGDKIGDPVSCR